MKKSVGIVANRPVRNPVGNTILEKYQRLPDNRDTFLAYVVAIRDPLNLHLDIYWPPEFEACYGSAVSYPYEFVSEELGPGIHTRKAYYCHLRGVEVISPTPEEFHNMKEAYIYTSTRVSRSNGWVLVSVSDIDVYKRVLVNIFDLVERDSLNTGLLKKISPRTGNPIAKEYVRPYRNKPSFHPSGIIPKDYHIVYTG